MIGKSYTRLKLRIRGIVERAAVAILPRIFDLNGLHVDVGLFVVDFVDGLKEIPANAEVQRQFRGYLEIILGKDAVTPLALAGSSRYGAYAIIRGAIQEEVGKWIGGGGGRQIRIDGVNARKVKEAEFTIVAGIKVVLLITEELSTELQQVVPLLPGKIIDVVK